MKNEVKVISKILQNGTHELSKVREGIYGSKMFMTLGPEFEFITEHFRLYSTVPTIETVKAKFPDFELEEAPEPTDYYIDACAKDYAYNSYAEMSGKVVNLLRDNKIDEIHVEVQRVTREVSTHSPKGSVLSLCTDIDERISYYDHRRSAGLIDGIPCGLRKLDIEMTGVHRSELTVITGRMYSGKTWMLIFWAVLAWKMGFNVIIFSKEMGKMQLSRRLDAVMTRTRFNDVKTLDISEEKYIEFIDKLKAIKTETLLDPYKPDITIIDSSQGAHGKNELANIEEEIRTRNPDIVFIDGAYLINNPEAKAEWEKQAGISRGLKQMCNKMNIPIVATTQANRGASKGGDLTNLSFSDSWGQDPDNVLYVMDMPDPVTKLPTGEKLIMPWKLRDGNLIRVKAKMDLDLMDFYETSDQILTTNFNEALPDLTGQPL